MVNKKSDASNCHATVSSSNFVCSIINRKNRIQDVTFFKVELYFDSNEIHTRLQTLIQLEQTNQMMYNTSFLLISNLISRVLTYLLTWWLTESITKSLPLLTLKFSLFRTVYQLISDLICKALEFFLIVCRITESWPSLTLSVLTGN